MSEAMGVLLTFTTYGSHLHGDEMSSVFRDRRNWGSPTVPPNSAWQRQARGIMAEPEFTLGPQDRTLVLKAIVDACAYRDWHLFCAHIRTNHVHSVVQTDMPVARALAYLKARATFTLKIHHPDRQRFWTKHGSTRYLWNSAALAAALDYVIFQQGKPMAVWVDSK